MASRRHAAKTGWLNSASLRMRVPAGGAAAVLLVAACLSLPLLLPAQAAFASVIGAYGDDRAVMAPRRPPESGLTILKAQMNALGGGLENLRRLREFFDRIADSDDAVLGRAQQLIETLPPHESAADAAWRIAAVASLTLTSGALFDLDIDDSYRLAPGAIGWDFGAADAPVHIGFTPVSPDAVSQGELFAPFAPTVAGDSALSDGITAVRSFEASLPNGLYRILIVRDLATDFDLYAYPFGREITLNGAPVRVGALDSDRERRGHTGAGERRGHTGAGERRAGSMLAAIGRTVTMLTNSSLGVEGWAIVEDGRLRIEFGGLPAGGAISAVIATPFDLKTLVLAPVVAEVLEDALDDIASAAGPIPVAFGPGPGGGLGAGATQATTGGARRAAPNRPQPAGGRGGFAASRPTRAIAPLATVVLAAPGGAAFEARQILLKRSISPGPDSAGLAIDLGALLDDASPSGVFACAAEPCTAMPPIAPEPELDAAALGDWLGLPPVLTPDWEALELVLAGWSPGSEIALVYEFTIDGGSWTDVELRASAGNGLFVWLDGGYIFGASEPGAFVDDLDFTYRIALPDLAGGVHYLQLLAESHDGGVGLAFELRGTPVGATLEASSLAVSEPGTFAWMALGLAGVFMARRNRRVLLQL